MRRNIAKVSALILAATTTMSPMMPAATTVAWADEAVGTVGTVGTVGKCTPTWDLTKDEVTITYKLTGSNVEHTVKYPVEYTFKENATCKEGENHKYAYATVTDATLVASGYGRIEKELVKGDPHYDEVIEHTPGTEVKTHWNVQPTHTTEGSYYTYKECTVCGAEVDKSDVQVAPKTAHTWEFKGYRAISNIKGVTDGTVTDKKPTEAADPTQDAKYKEVWVCKEDNVEDNAEERYVTIKGTPVYAQKFQLGENTAWKDNKVTNVASDIVLVDHNKKGTYTTWGVDTTNSEIVGTRKTVTIEAQKDAHTYGAWKVLNDSKNTTKDYLKLNANGTVYYTVDAKTGEFVFTNTSCVDATVELERTCTSASEGTKAKETKIVTVPAAGTHRYETKIVSTYQLENDKVQHGTKLVKTCLVCGDTVELKDGKANHKWTTTKENVVEATCGKEGSFDLVTSCEDCGYVSGTQHYTVAATNEHDYEVQYVWAYETDPYVPIDKDKALPEYVIESDKYSVAAKVYEACSKCGEYKSKEVTPVTPTFKKDEKAVADAIKNAKEGYTLVASRVKSGYEYKADEYLYQLVYKEVGKDAVVVNSVSIPVYADKTDYAIKNNHRHDYATKQVTEDGVTYNVTYCTKCGEELSKIPATPEKTLGQVEGLKATAKADGQVEVSWDALEGADGYLVVAINGKVRGQQIGYTAGTSFVDKDANAKDYNYYWVIPYFKNADGKVVKGQLTGYVYAMKQTEFAAVAESTDKGVALTWDAVEGASKYIVKAKAASEKTATAIATVTGTEYVDAAASADEYTFYWVFPVYTNAAGKDVVGNASNYVFGMTK